MSEAVSPFSVRHGSPMASGAMAIRCNATPDRAADRLDQRPDEDRVFMRALPRSVIGLVLTLLLLFFMADMLSRAYNLTWFPWQIKMSDHYDPQSRSSTA